MQRWRCIVVQKHRADELVGAGWVTKYWLKLSKLLLPKAIVLNSSFTLATSCSCSRLWPTEGRETFQLAAGVQVVEFTSSPSVFHYFFLPEIVKCTFLNCVETNGLLSHLGWCISN